jgi:multidrug efflux pump subunit AcrB
MTSSQNSNLSVDRTASSKDGFAGNLARIFVHSKLTPVIAIASIFLGIMAVWLTPKEEEPQISVPMIDIQIPVPGFEATEVERKVTEPIERAMWGLEGVEYIYSASQPHGSVVTVRFKVGESIEPSLVKVHHKLLTIRNELPPAALTPTVKSNSIDDVPFLVLTFSSEKRTGYELRSLIAPLARELSSTSDLSKVELLGGQKRAIRVIIDPHRLGKYGVSIGSVAQALIKNNALLPAGKTWGAEKIFDVEVGGRIASAEELGAMPVGQRAGRVVRIGDIAEIKDGPEEITRSSILVEKANNESAGGSTPREAVSIVFAKRKGTNVVTLAKELLERAQLFMAANSSKSSATNSKASQSMPSDVQMTVVRDYGATAADKSMELIEHLLIATLSVTILIAFAMGLRASIVVATAIPVTLALTLAIYYFMGYTLNRVTLFALIFSIGILVDDAIVVVENIERHLKLNHRLGIVRATIAAVAEVGNPTILATFTVIAAILPMAFVRGLMGPYMKPIPVGASLAMIVSLFVAFIVTPWAAVKILKSHNHIESEVEAEGRMDQLYRKAMNGLLNSPWRSIGFGAVSVALLLAASALVYTKHVKVKMLPFDNKNEFQILVDYPTTTPLEKSRAMSVELAQSLLQNPSVIKVQVFAGEPAPFSFSGMVKHTFLRHNDYMNDIHIVLTDKSERKIASHKVIEALRPIIRNFEIEKSAVTKVLEIPPGPPVLSTMLAEVYGPDKTTRESVAKEVHEIFKHEPSVVDLDFSWRPGRPRLQYQYDLAKGGLVGANAESLAQFGHLIFSESPLLSLNEVQSPEDVTVDLSIASGVRSSTTPFVGQTLPSFESGVLQMSDALKEPVSLETETLMRKNLKPVSYVMSELSGEEEAPVYGIMKLEPQIKYQTQTAEVPWNTRVPVIKWDGEWFITYEVFRDLGGAFAVVMILIYVLVLGWFKSFSVPLIIMAPIPISLIGILPGHAIFGAYFTATSMIGFIAGAGIIVRNSIILIDFIEQQISEGMELQEAIISAGVLRFRPMLLTAAAVVVGSAVMLFDPIFQGLALSLMFGEIAATFLSRAAVPILYFWLVGHSRQRELTSLASRKV